MGKRSGRPSEAPISDLLPHSSQMDALLQQESSPRVENNAVTPVSSILELVGDPVKFPKSSQLLVHQPRFSRAMFLRNPSLYTLKYSRQNMGSHANTSTSHAKVTSLHEDKAVSKAANKSQLDDVEQHTDAESLAKANQKPERAGSSLLSTDAPFHDMGKMCRICQRLLKKKPQQTGNAISSGEPSVVAVLVCGHVYHADCLEEKTRQEERMDPSCPLCCDMTC